MAVLVVSCCEVVEGFVVVELLCKTFGRLKRHSAPSRTPVAAQRRNRAAPGFTLIELMVTLALVAFLAMVSLPFTSEWISSHRMNQAETLLRSAVAKAKAEAMKNSHALAMPGLLEPAVTTALCWDPGSRRLALWARLSDGAFQPCTEASPGNAEKIASWDTPSGVTLLRNANAAQPVFVGVCFDSRGTFTKDAVSQACGTGDYSANLKRVGFKSRETHYVTID
jgi:prepilin-type N-terminal cleavage/methylation domain-containing protein